MLNLVFWPLTLFTYLGCQHQTQPGYDKRWTNEKNWAGELFPRDHRGEKWNAPASPWDAQALHDEVACRTPRRRF